MASNCEFEPSSTSEYTPLGHAASIFFISLPLSQLTGIILAKVFSQTTCRAALLTSTVSALIYSPTEPLRSTRNLAVQIALCNIRLDLSAVVLHP